MTICPECRPLVASTQAMLANRLRKINNNPDVQTYRCFNCGSTEWVTTDKFIGQPRVELPVWSYIKNDKGLKEMKQEKGTQLGIKQRHGNVTAGLATLSAIIIVMLVVIGWWR